MFKIPRFRVYGQDDPKVDEEIQPRLDLRKWSELEESEKKIAFREMENTGWAYNSSREILKAIEYINFFFLRQCPGKNLHERGQGYEGERMHAAFLDFRNIFLNEKSDVLVFRMLTKFAEGFIRSHIYNLAEKEEDDPKRRKYIDEAFQLFDKLASSLNHIFEQFCIDAVLTRNGLVPRQDEKIATEIYVPTLKVLADPKWKSVSEDLAAMFTDYREENYAEVITKAHRAIQRFLQILVGEEGKSGKGEVGKLFARAKEQGIISVNRFTEPIIQVFQGFISSERATNSTAKPTMKDAKPSDALLVMNVVMVFLQHCLQENR